MGSQIFRLKDIIYNVRKHISVIITMTVCGLLVGIMFYVVQTLTQSDETMYKIFVSFTVDTSNEDGLFTNNMRSPGINDFTLAPTLVDWVTYIVQSEKVCKTAVEQLNLIGVTTKSVQRALSVNAYGETSIMELSLRWQDSSEGVDIIEAVMSTLPSAMRSLLSIGRINRIEGPVVTTISTPVGNKSIFLFPVLGLLGSLVYCFAQMYMHPTLIDIKDVGELFGMSTLSVIDEDPTFEDFLRENLITNRDLLNPVMKENFTTFAHILLHQIEDDYFSLFVTSSLRGEGKTLVVANLGISLAALDKRVLLIDFDLTSPTLGSFFLDEVNYKNTVNAVYFDDVSLNDALLRVSNNLYLLLASLDKRHIGIDRFAKKLVSELETQFDVVLMDTPPLGENSDTLYFNTVSKNALYVIRYDYAGCDLISENVEKLNKAGTSLLGAVINRVPSTSFQFGAGRKEAEEEPDHESVLTKFYKKLPFVKKKEQNLDARRIKTAAADSDEADSFDSDDDLIDTEDFSAYLSLNQKDETSDEKTTATKRKNTSDLADDTDDERVARVEAKVTEIKAKKEEPVPDPKKEISSPPEKTDSPAETLSQAKEPKKKPKAKKIAAEKSAPPKPPAIEQSEQSADEEDDEDARFARIFSTEVNHLSDDDDIP